MMTAEGGAHAKIFPFIIHPGLVMWSFTLALLLPLHLATTLSKLSFIPCSAHPSI